MIELLAETILGKLASFSGDYYVVEEIKAANKVKKDLKIIEDKTEAICAVLEDAEDKGYTNKRIKVWLRYLKSVLYDIDDLLDEVAYDAKLRKANEGHFTRQLRYYASSSNPIISPFVLSHKIKNLREKLDNMVAKKNDFGLDEHLVDNSSRDEVRDPFDGCPFVYKPTIIGRDEAKQDVLAITYGVSDATKLSVLPILGMGGIGKTALAKLVYNDVQHFDLKFQIRQIIEDIVKRHFSSLRILELGHCWFEKLPKSIGKLKHLRFLNLSYNPILKNIPSTIHELLNLEYLNFCGCEELKKIPENVFQLQSLTFLGVTKFKKLSSLWIESCTRLEYLWESGDVEGLTSLRQLQIINCPKLKCLPNNMKFLVSFQSLMIVNCDEFAMEDGEGLLGLQTKDGEYCKWYSICRGLFRASQHFQL